MMKMNFALTLKTETSLSVFLFYDIAPLLVIIDRMYEESTVIFPSTECSILTIDSEAPDSRTRRISLFEIMFPTIAQEEKPFYFLILFEYISLLHAFR